MKTKCTTVLAAFLLLQSAHAQEAIPSGFRIVDESQPVRFDAAVARKLREISASTNRQELVSQYSNMLSSLNVTSRMFAVVALGNIQSPLSWDALFSRTETEQDPRVVGEIRDSLAGLLGYGWPGEDDFAQHELRAELRRWQEHYSKLGYLGVWRQRYEEVKGNLEAETMFVHGALLEWPGSDLLPVVSEVASETTFDFLKEQCNERLAHPK
jgi:hypothetical protein